jgi:hypothetical protein
MKTGKNDERENRIFRCIKGRSGDVVERYGGGKERGVAKEVRSKM